MILLDEVLTIGEHVLEHCGECPPAVADNGVTHIFRPSAGLLIIMAELRQLSEYTVCAIRVTLGTVSAVVLAAFRVHFLI